MDVPWLKKSAVSWRDSITQGRVPHAVLLAGGPGRGKRILAEWLARAHLLGMDQDALPTYPLVVTEHADLRRVSPAEDKQTIGVDQIRGLVADLNLTSYEGTGKVAIIEPADAMTTNAANSLLKTLEEPPGNALLILVADRIGRLPATIFSRCQRLSVPVPGQEQARRWLDQLQPAEYWVWLLAEVGNAPLAAIEAAEQRDDLAALARDFADVGEGRASPLEVAGRWARYEPEFVLKWLSRQVQKCIQFTFGGGSTDMTGIPGQSVLQRIDRRNLFCYLDTINGLRGQAAGSFNTLLTLESLLIDWAEALQSHGGFHHAPGLRAS